MHSGTMTPNFSTRSSLSSDGGIYHSCAFPSWPNRSSLGEQAQHSTLDHRFLEDLRSQRMPENVIDDDDDLDVPVRPDAHIIPKSVAETMKNSNSLLTRAFAKMQAYQPGCADGIVGMHR